MSVTVSVHGLDFLLSLHGSAPHDISMLLGFHFLISRVVFLSFQTVFIFSLVTILFLLPLNTISFLTICFFQLPPVPLGWFEYSLPQPSPHHTLGTCWLKAWYFMSWKQPLMSLQRSRLCISVQWLSSAIIRGWTRFFYFFLTSSRKYSPSPKSAAILVSVSL